MKNSSKNPHNAPVHSHMEIKLRAISKKIKPQENTIKKWLLKGPKIRAESMGVLPTQTKLRTMKDIACLEVDKGGAL